MSDCSTSVEMEMEMDTRWAAEILISMQYDWQRPHWESAPVAHQHWVTRASAPSKLNNDKCVGHGPASTPTASSSLPPFASRPLPPSNRALAEGWGSGTSRSEETLQVSRSIARWFTCPECPKGAMSFSTADELDEHLWYHDTRSSHTLPTPVTPPSHRTVPQGCSTCPLCSSPKLAFASSDFLEAHLTKMHGLNKLARL
ncbi:hypothetical protein CALCODRAFT_82867 [Calocera cornea HHB12733]|uniref:C2H2-type domain-containing protein n=1 Tax=Calocera cornea HHB12733 TaxID=1353952 RepID=A0A165DDH3_9BASI|nr:hypothetical protein CALCODRAFT_82867 [Calocera cornea HHB12733]